MRLAIQLLLAAMALAGSLRPAATVAQGSPDPGFYLPTQDELPPGFVYQAQRDETVTDGGGGVLFRWYVRQNPEVGPDDSTLLQVGATVSPSASQAQGVFRSTIRAWEDRSFHCAPFEGTIGEEAVTCRIRTGDDARPTEGVVIYFRVGGVNGVATWTDFADLPNFDNALAIARRIEARALAATPPMGSRDRPAPMRSPTILSNGWQITVLSTTPNANDAVRRQNQLNDPPAAGNQFYMVRVQVTNSGGSDNNRGRSFSGGDLRAVGDSAVAYTTFSNSCGVIPDALPRSEVFPGGSVTGNVCWQVRTSDAGSLVMFYDVGSGRDAQRMYFALR